MQKLGQLPTRNSAVVLGKKASGTPNNLGRRPNPSIRNTRIPANAQTFRSTQPLPKF